MFLGAWACRIRSRPRVHAVSINPQGLKNQPYQTLLDGCFVTLLRQDIPFSATPGEHERGMRRSKRDEEVHRAVYATWYTIWYHGLLSIKTNHVELATGKQYFHNEKHV